MNENNENIFLEEEEEQELATREEMIAEAVERMNFLSITEQAIEEFRNGKLNKSERLDGVFRGILYWLTEEEQKHVTEFEEEHGCLVYHVILTHTKFGDWYTYLYVTRAKEEWVFDWEDLSPIDREEEAYVMAYVYTGDYNSEFGSVGIEPVNGGVDRVA